MGVMDSGQGWSKVSAIQESVCVAQCAYDWLITGWFDVLLIQSPSPSIPLSSANRPQLRPPANLASIQPTHSPPAAQSISLLSPKHLFFQFLLFFTAIAFAIVFHLHQRISIEYYYRITYDPSFLSPSIPILSKYSSRKNWDLHNPSAFGTL